MATAEEIEKLAAAKQAEADKPLPAMVSPTVNLVEEIRSVIALRCRETGESFSVTTNKMWLDLLKKEKLVSQDLAPDLTPKRGGGGAAMKAKIEEKDETIVALQKEIAALKAAKK